MGGTKPVIEQDQTLMRRLSCSFLSAKLRRVISLRSAISNVARWSSLYQMLKRYIAPKPHISDVDDNNLDDLLLPTNEEKKTGCSHCCLVSESSAR